jgi:predicted acylesterase/phospholipase RssA
MATAIVNPVSLKLVVGILRGTVAEIDGQPATTFEGVLSFDEHSFDDEASRERVYQAVTASAAFPIVFAPINVEGLGPCYDGGAVNDAPIKHAIEAGADRIFVIAPYPRVSDGAEHLRGMELALRLIDVLIHERLFRDLQQAALSNAAVERVLALSAEGRITAEQAQAVLDALRDKPVEIISIRPDRELEGSAFGAFFRRDLRDSYIEAGRQAARAALAGDVAASGSHTNR